MAAEAQAESQAEAPAGSQLEVSDQVAVEITNMNKWFGTFHVLRDIDLTVYQGERIVIAGPSGSGKSTLIRCINALEEHQRARSPWTARCCPMTSRISTGSGRRSGWCSSISTCSRI